MSDVTAGRAFIRLALSGRAQVEQGIKSVGRHISSIAGLATKLTATIGAIGLGAGFIASIKAASDMEETMSKFNTVFGESSDVMKKWSDDFASRVGRSQKQIASFLSSSQDLLVPLGFNPSAARELSKQITQLAIDLGSFNNMADEDVFRDLQAAITGSGEVMKKYGVVVNEARVKQELLNQKIDPRFATEAEKGLARYNIILQGTTAAQGDAIRTSDSFANQWKRLIAEIDNAKVSLGEKFLPAVTSLVSAVSGAVLVMGKFAANTAEGAGSMDAMSISTESLIDSLGGMLDFLSRIIGVIKAMRAEIKLWSADVSDSIASVITASNPLLTEGDFWSVWIEQLRAAAEEARAAAEQLQTESRSLLDSDRKSALQSMRQQILEENAEKAAELANRAFNEALGRSPETSRRSFEFRDPVEAARGRHGGGNLNAGRSQEEAMERLAELKKIEANTRKVIPMLDAVQEGTLEAAQAEWANDQNAVLLKELEEQRRQTAELRKIAATLVGAPGIGILRL